MIKKLNFIDIIKINILIYYYLIRDKKNKLFFINRKSQNETDSE